jgi:phosphonate transport system permease protein
VDWGASPFHSGGGGAFWNFLRALFPPDLSLGFLRISLAATWPTLAYAVAGMTVAVAIGLPLGILASGTVVSVPLLRWPVVLASRFSLGGMRAIHELVWALLLLAAFGLSPLVAVLALGIPYGGILGRIYSELLHDVPAEPLRALGSAGASPVRQLLYGRIPLALPDMVSYTFYRFECAIRSAAIMSFVGIPGLGFQIKLSLDDLLFRQVWTLLLFMLALVVLVDQWSSLLRRKLAS